MTTRAHTTAALTPGRTPSSLGEILRSGALGGILGGIAMAGWMVIAATLEGMDPLEALEPMGSALGGPEAGDGGGQRLALGLLLHLLVAGAWGVVLAAMLGHEFPAGMAAGLGVGFAFFALGVMMSVVVTDEMRAGMRPLGGAWVIAHAVYGLVAGWSAQRLRQRLYAGAPLHARTT
jgi:hypothetical protein